MSLAGDSARMPRRLDDRTAGLRERPDTRAVFGEVMALVALTVGCQLSVLLFGGGEEP